MTDQTIGWLRELAAKGGKGVVNNIDARCLSRVADELERLNRHAQRRVDRDLIALDAAHQIEALPSDLHEAQKTARIQLIVLAALSSTSGHAAEKTEGGAA